MARDLLPVDKAEDTNPPPTSCIRHEITRHSSLGNGMRQTQRRNDGTAGLSALALQTLGRTGKRTLALAVEAALDV